MKDINTIFAENLKKQLERNAMMQMDFADKMGVSQAAVSHWINGDRTPKIGVVAKMCEILHCQRSDLLMDSHESRYVELTSDEYHLYMNYKKAPEATKKAIQLLLGVEVSND